MGEISTKSAAQKSEAWLSAITAMGTVVAAYTSHIEGSAPWVALGVCLALTAVYAFFRTPLASTDAPGVKTRSFWVSILVIVGSLTAAIAEADIPGMPPKMAQAATMISAAIVAAGYNIWRYRNKTGGGSP